MSLRKGFILFSALAFFSLSSSLRAATVEYTGGEVSAIDGLIVDGVQYNVTFDAFVPDVVTFLNNVSGANDAVDAINVVLNGPAAQAGVYFISDPPYGSQFFEVSFAIYSPTADDVILGNLTDHWINQGPFRSDPGQDSDYAHFALAPEPASFLLLCAGLAFLPYGAIRLRNASTSRDRV